MDKAKVAGLVVLIALALVGLAYGLRTVSKSEDYAPSPGNGTGGRKPGSVSGEGKPSSAPGMPGGPPSNAVPGSVH